MTDREIEDAELARFARGSKKYDATQRARLAYVVDGILRDRGLATAGADDDALVAIARAELARGSSVATKAAKTALGRSEISAEQARALPRFDFIAHWLAIVTRKKENRDLAQGKRVRRAGKRWQVVSANGSVEYETSDADRLFDYARRGPLGWWIRKAEEFRGDALAEASR